MSDYRVTNISGIKWTRAVRLEIDNQFNELPRISIKEEDVINVDGAVIKQPVSVITAVFNPDNPIHVAAQLALENLYTELRTERDNEGIN